VMTPGLTSAQHPSDPTAVRLAGDWDYYRTLGGAPPPEGGFEGRRRRGFVHFERNDAAGAWIRARSGAPLVSAISEVRVAGDSVFITLGGGYSIQAKAWGDSIVGRLLEEQTPQQRVWLVRRATPPLFEPPYRLWPGAVSESTLAVRFDTAVAMRARDGTTLMNFVARPVGAGPFPVVLERTPYGRVDSAEGRFWAARGYMLVMQDMRGRGGSGGELDMNWGQDRDGYDAVEWAASLPGADGRVGMVGASDPGLLAWYAAIAHLPHLTTIAPSVATADPLRIVPYIDMVFSPTVVPWLCLTRDHQGLSSMNDVDVFAAFRHLPVVDIPRAAGCPTPGYWNEWFQHPRLDDYWRVRGVENRLQNVRVPVLNIGGWYDDSRGPVRNYTGLDRVANHPFQRLVMGPGAHKGIDWVQGDFGLEARVDTRMLQLRWFDHYLKGIDNGVDREPPVDLFIMGDNRWRQEHEWPLRRTRWTRFYLHSSGVLDTLPPQSEPADTFTYDPGDPTPFLVDARELELSINEDYAGIDSTRQDLLLFTTAPLAEPTEMTGPMSATIWAATDARDTDWNLMLLDVYPDGRALRIQDGVARARFRDGFARPRLLAPGRAYRYHIDLWFTGLVLPPGHRLRVAVSSAAFPKYDRNLNTGGDNERDSLYVAAHQRVFHDSAHPSHVTLPLVPR
jgi:putative CocE/NonD family hydrolase